MAVQMVEQRTFTQESPSRILCEAKSQRGAGLKQSGGVGGQLQEKGCLFQTLKGFSSLVLDFCLLQL